MEKRKFNIKSNKVTAKNTYRLELTALEPGYKFSGEFVDIELEGFYLRRPISVCDAWEGGITLLYKVVGDGTRALSRMPSGSVLDVLTGLGNGFDAAACRKSALLVGGGLGAAPLYRFCKELCSKGREVTVILGFNSADEIVLEKEFRALTDKVSVSTADGSAGVKGFVTDAVRLLAPQYDYYYTCGPLVMMKALHPMLEGSGEYSLEERMGCGAGFCYGCSCQTLTGTKRICKDGPVFKKEELLW